MNYDVIIVGARCAGAATALQLACGGKRVLMLERSKPGTDTMSTHALMRGAVIQLQRWGLLDQLLASGAPEVTRTSFAYGREVVDVDVRQAHGTRSLIAPRRYVLDSILSEAAVKAGADIEYGASFIDVMRDVNGRVTGVLFDGPGRRMKAYAPLVIGADGRRSTVARRVGAPMLQSSKHATQCVFAYVEGLPDAGYEWFYNLGLAAGAIPTHNSAHCVFASAKGDRLRPMLRQIGSEATLRHLVAETNPSFGRRLESTRLVTKPLVFGGEAGFLRQATGPGWALVGDAGYFKDPITAHGITDAFRDSELLSKAILNEQPLEDYEAVRNAWSAELFAVTNRIAALDWTMSELKQLHLRLNAIMKAEQAMLADDAQTPIAA